MVEDQFAQAIQGNNDIHLSGTYEADIDSRNCASDLRYEIDKMVLHGMFLQALDLSNKLLRNPECTVTDVDREIQILEKLIDIVPNDEGRTNISALLRNGDKFIPQIIKNEDIWSSIISYYKDMLSKDEALKRDIVAHEDPLTVILRANEMRMHISHNAILTSPEKVTGEARKAAVRARVR